MRSKPKNHVISHPRMTQEQLIEQAMERLLVKHSQKVEDLNTRLQMIEEKIVNIKPEEEFVLPNESPLLSVIKNYQKVKIQDPDKAKSQFSQVRKILMKDKDFQEYCKVNDFYSDNNNKTLTEDPEENSSDISNLISPFKSILLTNSQTPPTISNLTPQDSASSLLAHIQPKSTGEIHPLKTVSNLYPKKETLEEKYNSQIPKTVSKDITKPSQANLKPPLTVKPKFRPKKKKSPLVNHCRRLLLRRE